MTAWKDLERRVCRALGGERRGPTGVRCSDCTDNVPFSVEIKRSARGVPEGRWIDQARSHGRRERKPWLLVVCKPASPRPVVVMDFWAFAELAQEAGRIAVLDIAAPLRRIERLNDACDPMSASDIDIDDHVDRVAGTLKDLGV